MAMRDFCVRELMLLCKALVCNGDVQKEIVQRLGALSPLTQKSSFKSNLTSLFHGQYDWTTGAPENGNEWRKFGAVPRSHPLRPLRCTLFNRGGNRRASGLPGEGGITSIVWWNLRPVMFGVEL